MMAAAILLAVLLAGFAAGYFVRDLMSRKRRADFRRTRGF